jgi:hypothetical protein
MQQELIWLSTSLFCNSTHWGRLMSEGIAGFVSSTPKLINYTIEFNYLSGENIRLALLVSQNDASVIAKNADLHFKNYFAKSNLNIKLHKPLFDGIFMLFPTNTIQYGLYPPQHIIQDEMQRHQTAIDLSEIMIEALQDEIDDEAIITFAFYLQMGLIRSVYKYLNNIDKLFLTIGDFANADNNLDENLTSDYSIMDEITLDVMQAESFDIDLNWMGSWTKQCMDSLLQTNDSDEIRIKRFYANRTAAIHRQLGLNIKSENLLDYLIGRSLLQYFITNK